MYKLTVEFDTIEELQKFVSVLPGASFVEQQNKPKKGAKVEKENKGEGENKQDETPDTTKTKAPFKLVNDDGTPLTKEDEIDKARAYLRSKLRPINEKLSSENKPLTPTANAIKECGGATSITVMDAKYYPQLNAKLDELSAQIIGK